MGTRRECPLFFYFFGPFLVVPEPQPQPQFLSPVIIIHPLSFIKKEQFFYLSIRLWFGIMKFMKRYVGFLFLLLSGCAYHNPLDEADFHFQTLMVPPYVLSSWYRIQKAGEPLVVYVEKIQMDAEMRDLVVQDKSENVAYVARPCQYFQTSACETEISKKQSDEIVQKGILQLQKKAATHEVVLKGF